MTKSVQASKPKKPKNDPDLKTVKSVATAKFSRDECLIIESFLAQYELRVDAATNKAHLKRLFNPKIDPIVKLNTANFAKLRYKIENIINPKNI
jgi:hypothetical protein